MTEAREEVKKCEQEIQSIKVALRGIGSVNSSEQNSLEIEFTKVEGLPETSKPSLKLQLSSPIEERDLTVNGEKASFSGVETSLAMLSIAFDATNTGTGVDAVSNGRSKSPIEVAPFCVLNDPKQPKDEYVTEVVVEIVNANDSSGDTSGGDSGAAVAAETDASAKEDTDGKEQKAAAEVEVETTAAEPPVVCTVTLRLTYKPSPKDQQEELCELLNKTSQSKAIALGVLRKLTIERTKSGAASEDSSSSNTALATKSSVKPGFLNKGGAGGSAKEEDDKSFLAGVKKWYQRVTNPDSIVMKTAFVAIVTKDLWIFFGAVGLMHYQGNVLSLPPPV